MNLSAIDYLELLIVARYTFGCHIVHNDNIDVQVSYDIISDDQWSIASHTAARQLGQG